MHKTAKYTKLLSHLFTKGELKNLYHIVAYVALWLVYNLLDLLMNDLFANPAGLYGFEFVEFASPKAGVLEPIFEMMGSSHVANHRSKMVSLYRQGESISLLTVNLIVWRHFWLKNMGPQRVVWLLE